MKILISAGPTREKIDPVRFISNHSSGKMGYALAEAALKAGHEVILVSGPVAILPPAGLKRFYNVESAAEMAAAIHKIAAEQDLIIMAAAVADYRPLNPASQKIKKKDGHLTIELEPTEDILASLGNAKKDGQRLAGFAAETQNIRENALKKLHSKNLDWIIANDVSRSDRGFNSENNAVTIFAADGTITELPLESKKAIAPKIIFHLTR